MNKGKLSGVIGLILVLAIVVLGMPANPAIAGDGNAGKGELKFKEKITPADQKVAAARFQDQYRAALPDGSSHRPCCRRLRPMGFFPCPHPAPRRPHTNERPGAYKA